MPWNLAPQPRRPPPSPHALTNQFSTPLLPAARAPPSHC
uniref:Uncharacterized protein n=1 Tax=Arundo donax TaxID=35708 RepID=A0A0A9BWS0_ARUDO